jgi:hypothetical protein
MSSDTTPSTPVPPFDAARQLALIKKAIARRYFCVLATSSAGNRPHAVGVMYAAVGFDLYVLVGEDTIKVRNVRDNPQVAVCIPVRRFPVGPAMAVQFQGTAEVLPGDDPGIASLLAAGRLKRIVGLGALKQPGVCFLKISPRRRISSYGIGVSAWQILRAVWSGSRSVELP